MHFFHTCTHHKNVVINSYFGIYISLFVVKSGLQMTLRLSVPVWLFSSSFLLGKRNKRKHNSSPALCMVSKVDYSLFPFPCLFTDPAKWTIGFGTILLSRFLHWDIIIHFVALAKPYTVKRPLSERRPTVWCLHVQPHKLLGNASHLQMHTSCMPPQACLYCDTHGHRVKQTQNQPWSPSRI